MGAATPSMLENGASAASFDDAGIGKDRAGIRGLDYLDLIGLPAATADVMTCHIADADHMLAHGVISHVNATARALGCMVGQTVRDCAERMKQGEPVVRELPPTRAASVTRCTISLASRR